MSATRITPPTALRALLVLDELPPGCIAYPVTDSHTLPHLMPGEFAIVDTTDRDPQHGELFLISYNCIAEEVGFVLRIVQTISRRCRVWLDGAVAETRCWHSIAYDRNSMLNGPYKPGGIERALVGRIIGILASGFEEPRRLASPKGGAS